jgi:acetyl-CoA carboxylase, biotin carboxylase subunit
MNKTKLKIKRVLIANRSEIAKRIQNTCHAHGIETVAIYTQEDQKSPYVYSATKSYLLSQNGCAGYLQSDEIINIALRSNSDAIHPGYGFLSEDSTFAQKVIDAGLIWVGPNPQCIEQMGNKNKARKIMQTAHVPIVPGIHVQTSNFETVKIHAQNIGYPVILKAALGGGGKAMRLVESPEQLAEAWTLVSSESRKYFNSDDIIIEKYIQNGRHIEVQVAGDGKNFIHLYERECSIQRRHQKIIEETPCNFVSQKTLNKLYSTALKAVNAISYENIGTVEFIVTPDENFYFLEINTRLQVEHAITEITTGIDLVYLQLHIATHNKLPFTQKEIVKTGHAIECRIYSENPSNNFSPCTGKINILQLPLEPFTRIDHDLEKEKEISPFFDPMLAKIITFGRNRSTTIKHMSHSLKNLHIHGITTNIDFLSKLITSDEFESGKFHTQLLNNKKTLNKLLSQNNNSDITELSKEEISIIAATLLTKITTSSSQKLTRNESKTSRWRTQQWK